MDLERIAETLAKKHGLTKDEYFDSTIESLYQSDGELEYSFYNARCDILGLPVLIPESETVKKSDGPYANFIKCLGEINIYLAEEEYSLAPIIEAYFGEGASYKIEASYLALLDHKPRDISELKDIERDDDTSEYISGLVLSALGDLTLDDDSIKIRNVFEAITRGYKEIHDSIRPKQEPL